MLKIAFMLLSLPPAESQFAVCHYPFATHGPAPVYRGDSHATHSAPGLASCVSGSRRAHCGRVSGHPGGGGLRPCGLGHCLPPGAFGPRTSPWDLSCRGGGGGRENCAWKKGTFPSRGRRWARTDTALGSRGPVPRPGRLRPGTPPRSPPRVPPRRRRLPGLRRASAIDWAERRAFKFLSPSNSPALARKMYCSTTFPCRAT